MQSDGCPPPVVSGSVVFARARPNMIAQRGAHPNEQVGKERLLLSPCRIEFITTIGESLLGSGGGGGVVTAGSQVPRLCRVERIQCSALHGQRMANHELDTLPCVGGGQTVVVLTRTHPIHHGRYVH